MEGNTVWRCEFAGWCSGGLGIPGFPAGVRLGRNRGGGSITCGWHLNRIICGEMIERDLFDGLGESRSGGDGERERDQEGETPVRQRNARWFRECDDGGGLGI